MQFIRKNFSAKIDILEAIPGPDPISKQKVWRRDSPNYQAQNTIVAYRLFSQLDKITFDAVGHAISNWCRDGYDEPGPGAALFPWKNDIPFTIPPNVTSVVVTVSQPSLVQIVPYSSVKSYCTDPYSFALYIKPGVPITQYQDLGTVTVTITVGEGVTVSSPALPIAAAEAYSATPLPPSGLNAQLLFGPKRAGVYWTDGGGETSYELQRQLNGGAWSTIATLPANTTSYQDTTVVSGAYRYQVRGINSYGNSTYAQSNVLGVS